MPDSRPIGMLDSGVGGLSVLRALRAELPHESVLYVADQGNLPYGTKAPDAIRGYVEGIARFLLDQGCKLLIIACNTANTAALHPLRALLPHVPIIGMEPAVKPAAERTRSGVIGVITTQVTFQSALFASVIDRFAQGVQVETQVCPAFVTLAEQGAPDTPEARAAVAAYLAPMKAAGVDQLVLGCTHFPFLARHIADFLGEGVAIIDPAPAVARQTRRVLESQGLLADQRQDSSGRYPPTSYFTSGDPTRFARIASMLLGETPLAARGIVWEAGALREAAPAG